MYRYGEVKYIVKLHFGILKNLAVIRRWLLLRGDRSWRFQGNLLIDGG